MASVIDTATPGSGRHGGAQRGQNLADGAAFLQHTSRRCREGRGDERAGQGGNSRVADGDADPAVVSLAQDQET